MTSATTPEGAPRDGHRAALGATIRRLRHGRGLTLAGLADLVGVSPATLSGIETGKTGLASDRLALIADALQVTVPRLLAPPQQTGPSLPRRSRASVDDPEGATAGWRDFPPLRLDPALGGALSSFLEFGYHGATMRTIAERSGLSVPGLYHHWASKQEMLVALLDLTMDDLRVRTEAARAEAGDDVERLALVVECLALFHTHRRDLGFVGASEMRSLQPPDRARVAGLRVDEQRVVDDAVSAGVRSGVFATTHPHEAARAVVTLCTALPQWFRPDGPASPEQVAAQYVAFALDLVRLDPGRRGTPATSGRAR